MNRSPLDLLPREYVDLLKREYGGEKIYIPIDRVRTEDIRSERKAGSTVKQVAERFHVSERTVYRRSRSR